VIASDSTLRAALDCLARAEIGSLLVEGGAALHAAAWDEQLVDIVRLYVTPTMIGAGGVPFLAGRGFSPTALVDRRVETLGPDLLLEGYVHRPR
jgi:riboflavin biosynthesis pyrimidine reductase